MFMQNSTKCMSHLVCLNLVACALLLVQCSTNTATAPAAPVAEQSPEAVSEQWTTALRENDRVAVLALVGDLGSDARETLFVDQKLNRMRASSLQGIRIAPGRTIAAFAVDLTFGIVTLVLNTKCYARVDVYGAELQRPDQSQRAVSIFGCKRSCKCFTNIIHRHI